MTTESDLPAIRAKLAALVARAEAEQTPGTDSLLLVRLRRELARADRLIATPP